MGPCWPQDFDGRSKQRGDAAIREVQSVVLPLD
jgi:hypothetical protein